METLRLQAQHLDLLLNMIAMMGFYCVDQRTELVSLMDHGLDHYQSVSVSYAVQSKSFNVHLCLLTAIIITLDDTTYMENEDAGTVEIKLLLDRPSCLPITVIVQPEIHAGDPSFVASSKHGSACV